MQIYPNTVSELLLRHSKQIANFYNFVFHSHSVHNAHY
jgi:hypothetical protein